MMKKLGFSLIAALAVLRTTLAEEAVWLTDFAKAQETAKKEKKLVLMDFTGSDWCPPCKALHKNVLTSKTFVDFAKDKLVLVMVDFPQHKELPEGLSKANEELSTKFKIGGLPTIIVLDGEGKELRREEGYGGESPEEFVAKLQKLKAKG